MKIAIYTRVSTEEQTTENQKIRLIQHAKIHGWDYEIFEEICSTRKTLPIKQDVLTRLRNKEFDGVAVYRLDRWGRSLKDTVLEITEILDKGLNFISVTESIDFSTPAGQLQYQLLAAMGQYERSILSQRTKEGLARAKAQGKSLGRPVGSKDSNPRKKDGYYKRYQKA